MSSPIFKLKPDLSNIGSVLSEYRERIKDWESHVLLDRKTLKSACADQVAWSGYYDQIKCELDSIMSYVEMKVKEGRGEAMKEILQNASQSHGEQAMNRLIDCHKRYLFPYQVFLEVRDVYLKAKSIVDQFEQRAYSLNNLTKLVVANQEDYRISLD